MTMDRKLIIDVLLKAMDEDDLSIFIGRSISKDAYGLRKNSVYIDDRDGVIALCLGMSMFYNKNIYVLFDDYYALRNLGDILSIAVSGNKNIRLVAMISGNYMGIESFPTIFSNMTSSSSLFFNMGFLIHDYTRHIKNNPEHAHKEINTIWSSVRSPLMMVFKVNVVYSDFEGMEFDNISTESIKEASLLMVGGYYGV